MAILSMKEKLEILRDATLEDDVFFSSCLDGSNECAALMLRIILGKDDLVVTEVRTQRWMQGILEHSVRLDVHAVDGDGNLYNIEIQKDDRGAERKRARYYSAMIDSRALGKGDGYSSLPESYVIFITRGDAIGEGKALYEIDRYIGGIWKPFSDGSHIVYVSSSLADEGTELGHLMHDLRCSDPEKMHYNELRDRVSYYKNEMEGIESMGSRVDEILQRALKRETEKVREESLKKGLEEGRQEGEMLGLQKGEANGLKKAARSMLEDGSIPIQKIAEFSGLTIGEVESIRNSLR